METTLFLIRSRYGEMGPAEKKIADYILQNPQDVISVSISELADRCGCGDATVVRFSRRLGFEGYQGLRIRVAQEFSHSSTVSQDIVREDTCYTIFRKRIEDVAVSLHSTLSVLDPEQMETAVQVISEARRIVIFGLGNSAAIAADAAHKFLRLGLDAQSCTDNHMQAIIASHLSRQCVAIGISHSGASRDIVESLRLARLNGATTIAVTNYAASPITTAADVVLHTKSDETRHSILAMNSRIAQLVIFDAIYSCIVVRQSKTSAAAIYQTETALQAKKF